MERHDQMLPEKIYQIERQPVAWNKDRVWMEVHARAVPRSRHRYYYRAAAAVLFVLISLAAWQPARQVATYTSCVEPVMENDPAPQSVPVSTPSVLSKKATIINTIPISKPDPDKMASNAIAMNDQLLPDSLPVRDVMIALASATDSSVATVERIAPIVGVVLPVESPTADARPRRKKILHTLEPFDKPAEPGNNSIIVARIK